MSEELKLAPCGGEPKLRTYERFVIDQVDWFCTIHCGRWKIEVQGHSEEKVVKEAAKLWNKRPIEDALKARNVELEKKYLGVLGLLCDCSLKVDDETRECIVEALEDSGIVTFKKIVDLSEITGFKN